MLRSDSATSLAQLLKEIGEIKGATPLQTNEDQNSGFDEEEKLINEELKKMKNLKSGDTSENNSLMGDTPSNYNEANLRFNGKSKKSKKNVDMEYEDPDVMDELNKIPRKKKRRRPVRQSFADPNNRDI